MGFRMKSQKLILSLMAFMLVTSCLQKQDLTQESLGPALSADEVQNKMADSIGNLNYSDLRIGETTDYTAKVTLQETQKYTRYDQNIKVANITDTATQLILDFTFSRNDVIKPENSYTNKTYQMVLEKSTSTMTRDEAHSVKQQTEEPKPFFLYRAYLYFALQGCREANVTCHNMTTKNEKMVLNPELANPKICADAQNCVIDIKTVDFDLLDSNISTDDGRPYRIHYKFAVSPQLPFLSKVLQYCSKGLVTHGAQKILEEDCMNVTAFSGGQNP